MMQFCKKICHNKMLAVTETTIIAIAHVMDCRCERAFHTLARNSVICRLLQQGQLVGQADSQVLHDCRFFWYNLSRGSPDIGRLLSRDLRLGRRRRFIHRLYVVRLIYGPAVAVSRQRAVKLALYTLSCALQCPGDMTARCLRLTAAVQ